MRYGENASKEVQNKHPVPRKQVHSDYTAIKAREAIVTTLISAVYQVSLLPLVFRPQSMMVIVACSWS